MVQHKGQLSMNQSDNTWLSAYLYYNEPWETFLINGVQPAVMHVLDNQWASQFFFIRYWEKGPHVRLRFKGNTEELEAKVKPYLIDHFNEYFTSFPSDRQEPNWLKDVSEERKWYPNNSIQFIKYEPEIERYGGDTGILIAENQFQASSETTFSIIAEGLDDWDYNRAMGAAIQLHLGFVHATGMSLEEGILFFSRFFQNWLPRAYYFFEKDITKEELIERKEETLKAFKSNFEAHKETLIPFFETVWHALKEGDTFEQEWLNNWIKQIQSIDKQLSTCQGNGQLMKPKVYASIDRMDESKQVIWAIYDSYIHMINNRLGIRNREESYLAYLVLESLKTIK